MWKRFLSIISIIFISVVACGCSSVSVDVRYTNGAIIQTIEIVLDKDDIENAGYDYTKVLDGFYKQVWLDDHYNPTGLLPTWLNDAKNNYNTKVEEFFEVTTESESDTEQEKLIREQNKASRSAYKAGYLGYEIARNANGFKMTLAFSNYKYFMFFNNIETTSAKIIDVPFNGNVEKETSFLFIKYEQTTTSLFNGCLDLEVQYGGGTQNVQTLITNIFNSSVAAGATPTTFTAQDVELIFSFTTPYSRLHSNGSVKKSAGKYIHSWIIPIDNTSQEIVFWRTQANTVTWYSLAIGVSVGAVILAISGYLIYVGINKQLKKKRNKKEEGKIN